MATSPLGIAECMGSNPIAPTNLKEKMKENNKDFNTIIANQIQSIVLSEGISSELKMMSGDYQMTITIDRVEYGDDEDE